MKGKPMDTELIRRALTIGLENTMLQDNSDGSRPDRDTDTETIQAAIAELDGAQQAHAGEAKG